MVITNVQQGVVTEAEFAKICMLTSNGRLIPTRALADDDRRDRNPYPAPFRGESGRPAQDRQTPASPRAVAKVGNRFPDEGTADQRPAPALFPGALRRQGPWLHRSRLPRSFAVLSQARAARSGRDLDQVPVQS